MINKENNIIKPPHSRRGFEQSFDNSESDPQGVFEKNGKWYIYLGSKNNSAEIPPEVARVVKVGLYANSRKERVRDDGITGKIYRHTNCHKTIFSATNIPNLLDDLILWGNTNSLFENQDCYQLNAEYEKTKEDLKEYVKQKLSPDNFGIAQIISIAYNKPIHSFFVAKNIQDNGFLSFEKVGFGNAPFRIVELEEMLGFYLKRKFYQLLTLGIMNYSDFKKKIKSFEPRKNFFK